MLGDITVAENIYIACGYTDMRKSIDGLAVLVPSGKNLGGAWTGIIQSHHGQLGYPLCPRLFPAYGGTLQERTDVP